MAQILGGKGREGKGSGRNGNGKGQVDVTTGAQENLLGSAHIQTKVFGALMIHLRVIPANIQNATHRIRPFPPHRIRFH